jgi:serine/threonine protein kinase
VSSEAEVTPDQKRESPPDRRARRSREERERDLRQLVGRTVAERYRIEALLGTGGMGAVYEAEHLGLGRRVAVKFIDHEHAQSSNVMTRFAREARAASSIESEHIVSVFDTGTDDGRPFLVMELLRGEDLGARLRRRGKLSVSETMHIAGQALRGLADAHEAHIVHRDLKPDNIFLVTRKADDSFVKIVDFGVSKVVERSSGTADLGKTTVQEFAITRAGTVIGTPLYMSPEQAQAASDLDARTDLYALGAIMFECLTGRPPHVGETYEQILLSICMNDAPDLRSLAPSAPPELARIVDKVLRKDRERRYGSARQMLVALSSVPSAAPATVPGVPPTLRSDGTKPMVASEQEPSTPPTVPEGAKTLLAGGAAEPVARAVEPARSSASTDEVLIAASPVPVTPKRIHWGAIVVTGAVATVLGAGITMWALTHWRDTSASSAAASSAPSAPKAPARAPKASTKKTVGAASAVAAVVNEPSETAEPSVPEGESTPSADSTALVPAPSAAKSAEAAPKKPAVKHDGAHAPRSTGSEGKSTGLDLERSFPK